jgi:hypothetical protein
MRNELIPLYPNRPPVLKLGGQVHYISVHDQEYFRKLREFRDAMMMTHPDRTGTSELFLAIKKKRDSYKLREKKFYFRLGLTPPDSSILSHPKGWYEMSDKYPARPNSHLRGRNARKKKEGLNVPA